MVTTKNKRTPGRPRRFDPDQAVATAQQLFHAKGYDCVSLDDLTQALRIKPPSFYSAFGNKYGLFSRVLTRYAETDAIPLTDILRDDRPVGECLRNLLEHAARRYGSNPDTPGCLVLEGTRCHDQKARDAARIFHSAAESTIHSYIAKRFPGAADSVTDFIGTVMAGLSAKAREGHDVARLLASARLADQALSQAFSD